MKEEKKKKYWTKTCCLFPKGRVIVTSNLFRFSAPRRYVFFTIVILFMWEFDIYEKPVIVIREKRDLSYCYRSFF